MLPLIYKLKSKSNHIPKIEIINIIINILNNNIISNHIHNNIITTNNNNRTITTSFSLQYL